jgi:hypothetical protein
VSLETSGADRHLRRSPPRVSRVLDIKTPGSHGSATRNLWSHLPQLHRATTRSSS